MTDVYIPPQGLRFRLLDQSGRTLALPTHRRSTHADSSVEEQEKELFTLKQGTGTRRGLHALASALEDNQSVQITSTARRGSWPGKEECNFALEPVDGGAFRLVGPSRPRASSTSTHSSATSSSDEDDSEADGKVVQTGGLGQQEIYVQLQPEAVRVKAISWGLADAKVNSTEQVEMSAEIVSRDCVVQGKRFVRLVVKASHTGHFERLSGYPLPEGFLLECGLPVFELGAFGLSTFTGSKWTFDQRAEFSRVWEGAVSAEHVETRGADGCPRVRLTRGELVVPFKLVLVSTTSGTETEMRGMWRGISTWDTRFLV